MALKTPMDENLFAQAVAYERYLEETFAEYKAIEISPLTNDGSMACIFAMVASRRVWTCFSTASWTSATDFSL